MPSRRTRSKTSSFEVLKSISRSNRVINQNKKKKKMTTLISGNKVVGRSKNKPNNSLNENVNINMDILIKFPLIKPFSEQQYNDGLDNIRVAVNQKIGSYNTLMSRYNSMVDDSKQNKFYHEKMYESIFDKCT